MTSYLIITAVLIGAFVVVRAVLRVRRSETDWYRQARLRVEATPELWEYRQVLLYDGWPDAKDHWQWLAESDIGVIQSWAMTVEVPGEPVPRP